MKIRNQISQFFKETPNSIRGYINIRELYRIILLALAAGGGTEIMIASLHDSLNTILVNPTDIGWISAVLVATVEILRRFQHGEVHVPVSKKDS
jgi:hypothetical protein